MYGVSQIPEAPSNVEAQNYNLQWRPYSSRTSLQNVDSCGFLMEAMVFMPSSGMPGTEASRSCCSLSRRPHRQRPHKYPRLTLALRGVHHCMSDPRSSRRRRPFPSPSSWTIRPQADCSHGMGRPDHAQKFCQEAAFSGVQCLCACVCVCI